MYGEVQLLEELDGVEGLVASEPVGNPLALAPAVVEVEHRGDRINTQRVDVVHVEPEQRAARQEVADFGAPVVENRAVPLGMEALTRVRVLVKVCAVEIGQAVL